MTNPPGYDSTHHGAPTAEMLTAWVKFQYEKTLRWPSETSGPVLHPGGAGRDWRNVFHAVSSLELSQLISELQREEDRSQSVLRAYLRRFYENAGRAPKLDGSDDLRGLPSWKSLQINLQKSGVEAKTLEQFAQREGFTGPDAAFTVSSIRHAARLYFESTGIVPSEVSGIVPSDPFRRTWEAVARGLKRGRWGFKRGTKLATILRPLKLKKKRSRQRASSASNQSSSLSPQFSLTDEQVRLWALDHYSKTLSWPRSTSGAVLHPSAKGESWKDLHRCARLRLRGLTMSVPELFLPLQQEEARSLAELRKHLRNFISLHQRLPNRDGSDDLPGIATWCALQLRLVRGPGPLRTLAQVAADEGLTNLNDSFTRAFIDRAIIDYKDRFRCWPRLRSGVIANDPRSRTWAAIGRCMRAGLCGFKKGTRLSTYCQSLDSAVPYSTAPMFQRLGPKPKVAFGRKRKDLLGFSQDEFLSSRDGFRFDELVSELELFGLRNIREYAQCMATSWLKAGRTSRLMTGVYAVTKGSTSSPLRPLRIGLCLSSDAVLSYRSALAAHGLSSIGQEVFVSSGASASCSITYDGVTYHRLSWSYRKQPPNGQYATTIAKGTDRLRATSLERTLYDCCKTPQLAGGMPEVLKAFRGVPLSAKRLLQCDVGLDSPGLSARVAWALSTLRSQLLRGSYLKALEERIRSSPSRFFWDWSNSTSRGTTYFQRWKLYVPNAFMEAT